MSLLLILALSACSPTWRAGIDLVEEGRFVDAADTWFAALEDDEEQGDRAARKGLERYGPDAYRKLLDVAQEHEAEKRYDASLQAYDDLFAFLERLEEHDLVTFPVASDLAEQRGEVQVLLTEYRYEQGMLALDRREWLDAIRWWERARELDEEYRDTRERIAHAYFQVAESERQEHQYAEAIAHYTASDEWVHNQTAAAWAAAIRAGLGRYYLREGACRAAVAELEAARPAAINDPELDQVLAAAEDCARVDLVVHRFEDASGTDISGTDVGTLFADQLAESLREQGSRHVRLIDPTAAVGQAVHTVKGRRYGVHGRVSQLQLDRPETVEKSAHVLGTLKVLCPGPEGYYSTVEEYCEETARVFYDEIRKEVEMQIAAAIRLVVPATGEQALTKSLESGAEHESVQVKGFRVEKEGEIVPVTVGAEPTEHVYGVDPALLGKQAPPPELPSDTDLVAEAAHNLAEEAARLILAQVDTEREVPPPRALADLRTPVMSAEDILIYGGRTVIQPERPPPPEKERVIILKEGQSPPPRDVQVREPGSSPPPDGNQIRRHE